MDISIEKYLLDDGGSDAAQVRVVARLADTHPVVAPFLVLPYLAPCRQGAHENRVMVLAERGDVAFYADSTTRQFGIAFVSATGRGQLVAGREYPSVDLAVRMFAGEHAALDPD
jgi:hypothetical protein